MTLSKYVSVSVSYCIWTAFARWLVLLLTAVYVNVLLSQKVKVKLKFCNSVIPHTAGNPPSHSENNQEKRGLEEERDDCGHAAFTSVTFE